MTFRDEAGRPVPEKLVAPFRAKVSLVEWIELFREMPRLLKECLVKSGMEGINCWRVENQVEVLANLIESTLPVAVCLCKGLDSCQHCGGKGWLSYGEAFLVKAAHGDVPKDEAWLKEVRDTFKRGSGAKSKLAASWKLSEAKNYVASELERWKAHARSLDVEMRRKR